MSCLRSYEGTFVGDLTDPSTFIAPLDGARSLINAKGGAPLVCPVSPIFQSPSIPVMIFPSTWISTRGKNQLDALAEADIMSSGLTYVIVKPCGLTIAVGAQKESLSDTTTR